jgi:hypothetical protein
VEIEEHYDILDIKAYGENLAVTERGAPKGL